MALRNPSQLNDSSAADARATPAMMGTSVATTGSGVLTPSTSFDRRQLKAGSSVLTVCVSEIATAANDTLAAMWPMACMLAGPEIWINSFLVIG